MIRWIGVGIGAKGEFGPVGGEDLRVVGGMFSPLGRRGRIIMPDNLMVGSCENMLRTLLYLCNYLYFDIVNFDCTNSLHSTNKLITGEGTFSYCSLMHIYRAPWARLGTPSMQGGWRGTGE